MFPCSGSRSTGKRERCYRRGELGRRVSAHEGTAPNSNRLAVVGAYLVSIRLRGARSQRSLNKQIRGASRTRANSGATEGVLDVVPSDDLRGHRLRW